MLILLQEPSPLSNTSLHACLLTIIIKVLRLLTCIQALKCLKSYVSTSFNIDYKVISCELLLLLGGGHKVSYMKGILNKADSNLQLASM